MYADFGFEHQKVYDPDQGPYVQLRDRHNCIIYMMSYVPKDGHTLLSLATAKEVVDLPRLRHHAARRRTSRMSESAELQYLPEEEITMEELFARERGEAVPRLMNLASVVPHAETYSAPEGASLDVEVKKLDDLLELGFIFKEEYEHRLACLKQFYS